MPRLSRWMVRTSLAYLGMGFSVGALLLFNKGIPISPNLWRLLPAHLDFLIFGWIVQLAIGVGYWIFPRYMGGKRGPSAPAWAAFGLFNLSILLTASRSLLTLPLIMSAVGILVRVMAIAAFVWLLWGRVKPIGT